MVVVQVCGLCGIRFAMVMDGGDGMFYSLVIVGIGVEVELGFFILCKTVEMKISSCIISYFLTE